MAWHRYNPTFGVHTGPDHSLLGIDKEEREEDIDGYDGENFVGLCDEQGICAESEET
jgi:hypothetical protein